MRVSKRETIKFSLKTGMKGCNTPKGSITPKLLKHSMRSNERYSVQNRTKPLKQHTAFHEERIKFTEVQSVSVIWILIFIPLAYLIAGAERLMR